MYVGILHILESLHPLQDYNTIRLKLEAEHWQEACEEMKKQVKELEEDLRESARREERTKLESLRQMQEIKGELTTTRAKVERERQRETGTVISLKTRVLI